VSRIGFPYDRGFKQSRTISHRRFREIESIHDTVDETTSWIAQNAFSYLPNEPNPNHPMKTSLGIIAAVALAVPWSSKAQEVEGFSVLKVCQEDLVLHTSDNQEAGRIGYVVVEPGSQRIVSALITGGVLAERVVAVPFTSVRFGGPREVTLVDINRERLVSAPVVERTHLTSTTTRFEPSFFERSYTHFGGNAAELRTGFRSETSSRTDIERNRDRDARGANRDRDRTRPDATDPSRTERAETGATERNRADATARRGSEGTSTTEANRNQPESRSGEANRSSNRPGSEANRPDSSGERRGSANRPDATSPDSPNNRPGASSDSNNASRPGASADKPNEPANRSANNPPANADSANKEEQAKKEAPTEKKTPGADSTDPANRRPNRDNPENKGAQQKSEDSSTTPKKADETPSATPSPSSTTGSAADRKPL
jgi:hypothetical protein